MKKNATVKDLEKISGKRDSVRNLNGENARSDKRIKTIVKEFEQRLQDFILPGKKPVSIRVEYADGSETTISAPVELMQASAMLNFGGHLS